MAVTKHQTLATTGKFEAGSAKGPSSKFAKGGHVKRPVKSALKGARKGNC